MQVCNQFSIYMVFMLICVVKHGRNVYEEQKFNRDLRGFYHKLKKEHETLVSIIQKELSIRSKFLIPVTRVNLRGES